MINTNTTQIIVRDFTIPARIGIYPEEHTRKQAVRINITMDLCDYIIDTDKIESTVSYEDIVKEIRHQASIHHNLVETLAEILARKALNDKRVKSVTVSIEKTEIFTEGSVGCIITRAN